MAVPDTVDSDVNVPVMLPPVQAGLQDAVVKPLLVIGRGKGPAGVKEKPLAVKEQPEIGPNPMLVSVSVFAVVTISSTALP